MSTAFVDRLDPLVRAGDVAGAQALLANLDGPQLTEAQQWFARSSRWLESLREESFSSRHIDDWYDKWCEAVWIVDLCAVRLCGPATAATRIHWSDHSPWRPRAGEPAMIAALLTKDHDWVAEFVEAASGGRLTGGPRVAGGEVLTRALRTVGRHHQLPCPTGSSFYQFWLTGCPESTVEEALANEPWMPELLYQYLASGHCANTPELPEAITALLDRGLLDRGALLNHILVLLTAPQRAGNQQLLAKILRVLAPSPEEINGGLDYLLGVISTSVGAVGRVLLPNALALLRTGDDVLQLVSVIASRSEKDQKKRLLEALKTLPTILGAESVMAALDILASDEDAAFVAQVGKVALGIAPERSPASPAEPSPTLGLWGLEPSRQPAPTRREGPFTWEWTISWPEFLTTSGRAKPRDQTATVNLLLTKLAEGDLASVDSFFELARRLLSGGTLVLSRVTHLLPDLFVAGGMREFWPRTLALADTCADRAEPLPSVADLLRTLAQFAPEVPLQPLPPALRRLAARTGNGKAQVEARVLGAALSRASVEDFVEQLRRADPEPPREPRGLWRQGLPAGAFPGNLKLAQLEWTPEQLARILSREFPEAQEIPHFYRAGGEPPLVVSTGWRSEIALVAVARGIREGNSDAIRSTLAEIIRKTPPRAVPLAIDLWASGLLDREAFWRMSDSPQIADLGLYGHVNRSDRDRQLALCYAECWSGDYGRVGDAQGFRTALADGPDSVVVLPRCVVDPVSRSNFLRACETLLLAEQGGLPVSTPSWQDGTLALDDLLERLAARPVGVGPIDLLQALYRLRRTDSARAADIPLGQWLTSPLVTTPGGDSSLDAGEFLQVWIHDGGLPPLACELTEKGWTITASPPVPWSTCIATLSSWDNGSQPHDLAATLRTFPRWPDLATSPWVDSFPDGASGYFGRPAHDQLLAMMRREAQSTGTTATDAVVLLARTGRLDPTAARHVIAAPMVTGRGGDFWHRYRFSELAAAFERVFEAGGLAGAWPTALAIATANLSDPGPGLAQFLRTLRDYAIEVPRPRASVADLDALRSFAVDHKADPVHEQARLLIAALED